METNKETWILYQTTNLINSKIYVGVHKVANNRHSRSYLGSGTALKPAIEKHGRENFVRVTLAEFACAEDAYSAEEEMVTEEFIKRKDTYNIKMGGKGSRGHLHSEETKVKIRATNKGQKRSAEARAKLKIIASNRKGRIDTEQAKAKRSAKLMGAGTPSSLPVIINGIYYESIKRAANILKINDSTIQYRIKSDSLKWFEWRPATNEEKLEYTFRKLQ